jgi:hypothetical protein
MAYNGWTNRETWLVNVWFNPESKSDIDYIREKINEDYQNLPDYIRDFVDFDAIEWSELYAQFDDETEE